MLNFIFSPGTPANRYDWTDRWAKTMAEVPCVEDSSLHSTVSRSLLITASKLLELSAILFHDNIFYRNLLEDAGTYVCTFDFSPMATEYFFFVYFS